ncbi:MAG: hypothetical protein JO368_11925 [Acidimicrobiales bacterium]|nr:hypothetical protein [Acidimicrobiales bacterium]
MGEGLRRAGVRMRQPLEVTMEDRISPVLYLEMTDRPAAAYAAERVPEVLGMEGIERGSWWANCVPFRDDLPRTLDEFSVLGLYEADPSFEPPTDGALPGDVASLCFDHYRRPGQGTVSERPTLGLELVFISPRTPEETQALRDWADFVHIRDIAAAACEHFTMITPYENRAAGSPRFMHLYELDTDDPEPAFQQMTPSTLARIGSYGAHSLREWRGHEALVIDYVNTFRRLGVRTTSA